MINVVEKKKKEEGFLYISSSHNQSRISLLNIILLKHHSHALSIWLPDSKPTPIFLLSSRSVFNCPLDIYYLSFAVLKVKFIICLTVNQSKHAPRSSACCLSSPASPSLTLVSKARNLSDLFLFINSDHK